ncbi:hypothetical protein B0G84_3968 [Paraburkholderia sp. BL8N3]|jgi:hypothetical protein|nr:hypothetical protein B0G84_3968 [Paraburkholderia sp. BL8N3]
MHRAKLKLVTCIEKARAMQRGSVVIPGSDGITILEET